MILPRAQILKNMVALFSGSAAAQGLTAIAVLFTARAVGSDRYGQYTSTLTLVSFFSLAINLGLDQWLVRESGAKPDQRPVLAGQVMILRVALGLAWLVFLFPISTLLDHETFPPALFHMALFTVLFDTFLQSLLATFRGALKNTSGAILEAGADLLWLVLTLWLYFNAVEDITSYLQVRLAAMILGLAAGIIVARKLMKFSSTLPELIQVLKNSRAYALAEAGGWALARIDVLILSFTLGSAAVGIYALPVNLLGMILLISIAVYWVNLRVLSDLFVTNRDRAHRMIKKMVWAMFLLGLLLAAGISICVPLLGWFLGESFLPSENIMRILLVLLPFKSISFVLASALVAGGMQHIRVVIQTLGISLAVILNLIVVYPFGVPGVAWVFVAIEVIMAVSYLFAYNFFLRRPRTAVV